MISQSVPAQKVPPVPVQVESARIRGAAPIRCCDLDVIVDPATRVFFVSTLYGNAAGTNGVVRIGVHRNPNAGETCFYELHSSLGGSVVPDYPHLGLTKRFLYLSANEVSALGQRAAMYRFDLETLEN